SACLLSEVATVWRDALESILYTKFASRECKRTAGDLIPRREARSNLQGVHDGVLQSRDQRQARADDSGMSGPSRACPPCPKATYHAEACGCAAVSPARQGQRKEAPLALALR